MNLHSQDIERGILAQLLVVPSDYEKISTYLKPDYFFFDYHRKIFTVIEEINLKGHSADSVSVTHELKKDAKFDPYPLTQITMGHVTIADLEQKCLIINQLYFSRELKKIGWELYSKADTDDSVELLEWATKQTENLWAILTHYKETTLKDIAGQMVKEIENAKKTGVSGIRTGFSAIDDITLGRNKGDLVIIAGRPSMGKTTIALNEAYIVAKERPVIVFSLEMPSVQLFKKITSHDSQVPLQAIRTGNTNDFQDEKIGQAIRNILNLEDKLFLYDIASLHINDLVNIVKKLKRTKGVECVYVDYIQLMRGVREKGATRDAEIGNISQGLKKLAMEGLSIVAMSQLNREVEMRGDKRPQLSDLRESGNLEQDADIVEFVFRPERYGIETIMIKGREVSSQGLAEIIIPKNRNGRTGIAYLNFNGETSTFTNYSYDTF